MKIESVGRVFCCSSDSGDRFIKISHIGETGVGSYRGYIEFFDGSVRVHSSTANISTARGRNDLLRCLNGNSDAWAGFLDSCFSAVVDRLMLGTPAVEIMTEKAISPHKFLVEPFLPLSEPSMIYGAGGSSKSYLALLLSVMCQLPYGDNPLSWKVGTAPTNILYADNETSEATIHRRLQQIIRGMGLPHTHLHYKSLSGLLTTELEGLQREIADHKVGLLIVDSVGKAVGGDMFGPSGTSDMFNGLRGLGVTTLLVHHESKGGMGESTPFGTVYFTTNSRMVWHVERDHEYSDDSFTVKLTNTKFNDGPIHKPIGLKLTFGNSPGNESLRFETCDLTTTEFASKLPLRDRLKESLRHGAMSTVELGEVLGESEHIVRTTLNRYKADFTKVGRSWGLKANGVNNVIL